MFLSRFNVRRQSRNRGLTLIELVVVLAILVALSALIIPQLDFLKRTADKTNGAANMKAAVENIQTYRTLKGDYPDGWDSLMDSTDNTLVFDGLGEQDKYVSITLVQDEVDSLTKIGIENVYDHDITQAYRGLPGNSGQVERTVSTTGGFLAVANTDIADSIYPGKTFDPLTGLVTLDDADTPADVTDDKTARLVVVGLGMRNEAVGQTLMNAPEYTGLNPLENYNKMLAVFAVYDGFGKDKRAQLKAFLDSKGDFMSQELAEIAENDLQ